MKRKIMLTPLELALILSLAIMTFAALFATCQINRIDAAAQFWQNQVTNRIICP